MSIRKELLDDLEQRQRNVAAGRWRKPSREAARQGNAFGARAAGHLLRRRHVSGMGHARRPFLSRLWHGKESDALRRRRHRRRSREWPTGGRVQPGRHRRRRSARAAARQEDLRHHGLRAGRRHAFVAVNDSGGARIQEGGRVAVGLRPGLLPQRVALGLRPADRSDRRELRRRRGLLAGADGFSDHDARERQHVHLRSASDQGRHRRRLHDGRNRQRRGQRQHQRQCSFRRRRRSARHANRGGPAVVSAAEQCREPTARADGRDLSRSGRVHERCGAGGSQGHR